MSKIDLTKDALDLNNSKCRRVLLKEYIGNPDVWKSFSEESQWQGIHTPFSLCTSMVNKTQCITEKQIGVLFNLEFLEILIYDYKVSRENITFYADTEYEQVYAERVYKVKSFRFNSHTKEEVKRVVMRKFDLVVSNPPYNGGVDLKILNEIYDYAQEFIIVHPSTWLMDNKIINSTFNNFRNKNKK